VFSDMAEVSEKSAPKSARAQSPAGADLRSILGEGDLPLSEVRALVGDEVLSSAWAGGLVEFGRVKHCLTGRPGVGVLRRDGEPEPTLVLESDVEWTGPKTPRHRRFLELAATAETLPAAAKFKRYAPEVQINAQKDLWELLPDGREAGDRPTRWTTVEITREEAARAFALRVRLTDRGLAGN
jgi:hypothetical protein